MKFNKLLNEYLIIYSSNCALLLWLYGPLMGLVAFSVYSSYTHSVGLLGRGISPSQGLYLHNTE
jgi:hypothetical protein